MHRGAAEAPRGTGARVAGEEDEVMSRLALAMGVSRLAAISSPAAQEEAQVRALRRAQLLAALKEKTAGIPEASQLWEEFNAIEQISVVLFSALAPLGPGPNPNRTCPLSQADDNAMSEVAAEVVSLLHCLAPGRARQPGDA